MGKKYFTVRELTKSYTANQHGIDNTPDEEQKKNLEDLIDVCLDPLRIFYPQKLLVYSGFRSFELNEYLGKSPNSFHLFGLECDIRPVPDTEEEFQKVMRLAKQLNFDTLILKRKFVQTKKRWFSYISISYDPKECKRMVVENFIINPEKVPRKYKNDFETNIYYLPKF